MILPASSGWSGFRSGWCIRSSSFLAFRICLADAPACRPLARARGRVPIANRPARLPFAARSGPLWRGVRSPDRPVR